MKPHTLFLMAALACAFVFLSGCVVWDSGSRDLAKYMKEVNAEEDPAPPIQKGDTLQTVIERLGAPDSAISHGKYLIAQWKYSHGAHLLMGFIGGSDSKDLIVLFDEECKALSIKATKGKGGSFTFLWPFVNVSVNDK
ncbi:MAG: hypothetical protein E3J72_20480 [Planctomycetota bacterium]|nr:MAG: hypothetical protein E3J72_20480 [Planctomycetota bacterium]